MKDTTHYNRIIFILSLIGFCIALYVTQSFLRKKGILCVNTGCELVRKSPASYLFGVVPVPSVGLMGYAVLAIAAFARTMNQKKHVDTLLLRIMLGMSAFGVVFVSWFTYTELFVIRGICTWCAISAVLMVCIFVLTSQMVKTHHPHTS